MLNPSNIGDREIFDDALELLVDITGGEQSPWKIEGGELTYVEKEVLEVSEDVKSKISEMLDDPDEAESSPENPCQLIIKGLKPLIKSPASSDSFDTIRRLLDNQLGPDGNIKSLSFEQAFLLLHVLVSRWCQDLLAAGEFEWVKRLQKLLGSSVPAGTELAENPYSSEHLIKGLKGTKFEGEGPYFWEMEEQAFRVIFSIGGRNEASSIQVFPGLKKEEKTLYPPMILWNWVADGRGQRAREFSYRQDCLEALEDFPYHLDEIKDLTRKLRVTPPESVDAQSAILGTVDLLDGAAYTAQRRDDHEMAESLRSQADRLVKHFEDLSGCQQIKAPGNDCVNFGVSNLKGFTGDFERAAIVSRGFIEFIPGGRTRIFRKAILGVSPS